MSESTSQPMKIQVKRAIFEARVLRSQGEDDVF
jgi:hypothetical protein